MPPRRLRWRRALAALLLVAAVVACTTAPEQAAAPVQRPNVLRLRADPAQTFRDRVVVEITVVAPDGRELYARAGVVRCATTQLVGVVLATKLELGGCTAHERAAESGPENMQRWMHRVLVLPAGWHFVRATATTADGKPSPELEVRLEGTAP